MTGLKLGDARGPGLLQRGWQSHSTSPGREGLQAVGEALFPSTVLAGALDWLCPKKAFSQMSENTTIIFPG